MRKPEARTFDIIPSLIAAVFCLCAWQSVRANSSGMQAPVIPNASVMSNGSTQFTAVNLAGRSGDLPSASTGAFWYDTVRKCLRHQSDSGAVSATWILPPTTADSTTLANPTSATLFSQTITVPAASLVAGRVIRLTAFGKYTTGTGLTPTLDVGYKIGGTAFASSGLISTAVSLTDKAWRSMAMITTRTVGASGSMYGLVQTDLGGLLAALVPVTQIARSGAFTVDTTVDNAIGVTAKFGVSDASNAITLEGLIAELLN